MDLEARLGDRCREIDFSGVVVAHDGGERRAAIAAGFADRSERRPVRHDTRFGTASATKGVTALTIASLIETGELAFETTLRNLLGDDAPHVDPAVTIEHVLGHTSGVGDYLDEETLGDIDDHVLGDVPPHHLDRPEAYLPLVAAPPQVFEPGARFAYNNGAYVLASIAAERATGASFYDLVRERVLLPAGMLHSGFYRSDRLPEGAALGYTADGRTNVFHLPVRGAGDGGLYGTVDEVESLWDACFAGRIVSTGMVDRLTARRSETPNDGLGYGLGFWLHADRPVVMLEGMDAGVSFRSARQPASGAGYTVMSNTSSGAWPLVEILDDWLIEAAS